MTYIHQLSGWPNLVWSQKALAGPLAAVSRRQGRLIGRMESLGFKLRSEAALESLTEEVIKSSEIEGEVLDKDQVRSSIARRLGVEIGALTPADRNVEGVVDMMLDATQNYATPLTAERLWSWQAALFPTGHSGMHKITVGGWRNDAGGPMQVVSGPMGQERVHYEAPAADRLTAEMNSFLDWFNREDDLDPVLKAGVAHFWFVTIHPFDDGNGRIARAIADLALARSENSKDRFYSMSSQIRAERKAYYSILEMSQKDGLDITPWLEWFLACLDRAFDGAEGILASVMRKARFWEQHRRQPFNDRQRVVLNRMLDGLHSKLTSSKWATLAKTSPDTALRDITSLVEKGVLIRDAGGGRSTSYSIAPLAMGALRELADYIRRHSSLFVQDGPRSMSPNEVAEHKARIDHVADRIATLADYVPEGAGFREFEPLLRELHHYGFYPEGELVSAVAFAFSRKDDL